MIDVTDTLLQPVEKAVKAGAAVKNPRRRKFIALRLKLETVAKGMNPKYRTVKYL